MESKGKRCRVLTGSVSHYMLIERRPAHLNSRIVIVSDKEPLVEFPLVSLVTLIRK